MLKTVSKMRRKPIDEITTRKTIVGLSNGMVISVSTIHFDAPSIRAAS